MRDLNNITYEQLFQLTATEDLAISLAQNLGLIKTRCYCVCGSSMSVRKRNDAKNHGVYFRCNVNICRKEVSILQNSFFEGSHLTVKTLLHLVYFFIRDNQEQEELRFQLHLKSSHTIVDWKYFCREIFIIHFLNNEIILGGPDSVVEIDEALLVRRKYNRGRNVDQQWLFGAFEVSTKKGFIVTVDARNRETLLNVIRERILPGSIVVSDAWRAYSTLEDEGYNHLVVNHKYNFVDPQTFATTNHVESQWQKLKQKHKQRYGTHRTMVASYIAEFLWRQRYGKNLTMFIEHVKEVYNINSIN